MEMLSSFLSKAPTIKILFENERDKTIMRNMKGDLVEYSTYQDTDCIKGKVIIELNKNKNFEHNGIKIELIGIIENYKDKRQSARFIALTKDLEPPGQLNNEITKLEFDFSGVEKQYETYKGNNISVRYFLQSTLCSKYKNIITEAEFVIFKPKPLSDFEKENTPLRIEVGVDDWLHVSFEIDKSKFFLRDVITGEVVFKKVSVRLSSMEIQIVKKETLGYGSYANSENEVLAKFEIMDGVPFKSIYQYLC
jgi:vacuolar protein sorting-associated protein 26